MPREKSPEFPAGDLPVRLMATLGSILFGLPLSFLIWLPSLGKSPPPLIETLLGISAAAGFLFLLTLALVLVVVGSPAWRYCLRGFLYALILVTFSLAVVPRIT